MKIILLLSILLLSTNARAMNIPGATEKGIVADCRITAELSVMLLKMKGQIPEDELFANAGKLLQEKGYNGSFGDSGFIAGMYTGLALQMGPEVDQAMAAVTAHDLEMMINEHEMTCLEKAITEFEENSSSRTPSSTQAK